MIKTFSLRVKGYSKNYLQKILNKNKPRWVSDRLLENRLSNQILNNFSVAKLLNVTILEFISA